MSNKSPYFIRSILQNSKLNREKFVNNKGIYNLSISKNRKQNFNNIIKRKMSSYNHPLSFGGGGGGDGGGPKRPNNGILYMFAAFTGIYISSFLTGKNR
jgi:hypothetical protein